MAKIIALYIIIVFMFYIDWYITNRNDDDDYTF